MTLTPFKNSEITLCAFKLELKPSEKKKNDVPPMTDSLNVTVIVQSVRDFEKFKLDMNKAPINNKEISIYDSTGRKIIVYKKDRYDNKPGTVSYHSADITNLSEIIIPEVETNEIIISPSFLMLDQLVVGGEKYLCDELSKLIEINGLEKLSKTTVIIENRHEKLIKTSWDLKIFNKVIFTKDGYNILGVVQYMMGHFNPMNTSEIINIDFQVECGKFCSNTLEGSAAISLHGNGFNITFQGRTTIIGIISLFSPKLINEFPGIKVIISPDLLILSEEQYLQLLDSIHLHKTLNSFNPDISALATFMKLNADLIISYLMPLSKIILFNSKSTNQWDRIIYAYFKEIIDSISSIICNPEKKYSSDVTLPSFNWESIPPPPIFGTRQYTIAPTFGTRQYIEAPQEEY